MAWKWARIGMVFLFALTGCMPGRESGAMPATASIEVPAPIAESTETEAPTPVSQEVIQETEATSPSRAEAILILSPGPGSRVTNPLHVEGVADPTFEQRLRVRVVGLDGQELASETATIQADVGQRGAFELDLDLDVQGEINAFIQVAAHSARDGEVIHLASVGVFFSSDGPEEIRIVEPHPERLNIARPRPGDTLEGGTVLVEGFGLASFEGTLVIEIQDAEGEVVGMQPVIVKAPEMGQPGPFQATLTYAIDSAQPGRIVVRDISPAFGGDVHLASVDVSLNP
jgi:hypothetical protein